MNSIMSQETNSGAKKSEAFLVVDGTKVFSIDKDDFSIGRKTDNDIIIDDPHVSRYHAKIRYINKKFVLFDLKSTVGTSVNGDKIDAVILNPGDVLSVGGVPIIFGRGAQDANLDASQPMDTSTGPTDSTKIDDLDSYIELFQDDE